MGSYMKKVILNVFGHEPLFIFEDEEKGGLCQAISGEGLVGIEAKQTAGGNLYYECRDGTLFYIEKGKFLPITPGITAENFFCALLGDSKLGGRSAKKKV